MKIFICIDDDGGILFNHRRISRDRILMQWIAEHVPEKKIYMAPYSEELFSECERDLKLLVSSDYLKQAEEKRERKLSEDSQKLRAEQKSAQESDDAYCFAENTEFLNALDKVNKIYLCKWNRRYPSDVKFPLDILKKGWKKQEVWEFPGSSHEKITVEEWMRK